MLDSPFEIWVNTPAFDYADPIAYWTAQLNSPKNKQLARMALDYLSIPGMYTYVPVYFWLFTDSIHSCFS